MNQLHVIGIGNPLRGDDLVGHLIVEHLRKSGLDSRVQTHLSSGDAADIVDILDGAGGAIICDATATDDPSGTVVTLDCAEPLPQQLFLCSSHAFGVAEGIELSRSLEQLPGFCHVVGVAGGNWAVGSALTEPMAQAVPIAAQKVIELISLYLNGENHA